MKIAIAQINTTVADIRGNVQKIRSFYRRAVSQGAELVLFPELAITGYPPWDLLEQPDFIRANLRALKELARATKKAGMVVGFVDENPAQAGKSLFNAAALLHQGKILAKRHKTLLPTYDVFDEARYFQSAHSNPPIPFRGKRLGITLCEDAWNDPDFWQRRLYPVDPVAKQVAQGADLLINIAASPYHRSKISLRRRMLQSHAAKAKLPFVYCALVGANDDLIFDGNSFALDRKARLILHAKAFKEDLAFVDTEKNNRPIEPRSMPDIKEVYRALALGLRDYAMKCGFQNALLGISGGIDSAVVAALAVEALGPRHVTGVALPSRYSSPESFRDAKALVKNLGIKLLILPIHTIFQRSRQILKKHFQGFSSDLAEQNLQARIRGNLLMALSNAWGALLLSTGNKSELSVGYCTLYGDMNGGLAVLGDVPKTTVYELAHFINQKSERIPESCILKPPSAELKPGQKDQDDLPPYEVLDGILKAYVEEGLDAAAICKLGYPCKLVREILERMDKNEYKRRQAPPVLKITTKAFGVGRRMPIARQSRKRWV